HADDVYGPAIVEREVDFLSRYPEAGAVFCLDLWIDSRGREDGRLELPRNVPGGRPPQFPEVRHALLENMNTFLVCPASLVRAVVYREVGGYRQKPYEDSADLDMWIRIARKHPIGILNEHLMSYRHTSGSSFHRYHYLRKEPSLFFPI